MLCEVLSLFIDLASFILKGLRNPGQYIFPGWPVEGRPGREISSPVKWFSLRSEKYIQWPAPATGHGLHRVHINMVQVGALLAIYLDIDKMLVHEAGSLLVFKTFLFHYMTPVTGCIPDTYKHGLVFAKGSVQSLFAPGIPVHRVIGMLKQVRTCFS